MRAEPLATTEEDFFKALLDRQGTFTRFQHTQPAPQSAVRAGGLFAPEMQQMSDIKLFEEITPAE